MPYLAPRSRWIRATVVSIPRPPSEVSSGMNAEPVWYTVRYSASRTACQAAESSRAAHGPLGGQPYIPPAMFRSRPARVESNWTKKSA